MYHNNNNSLYLAKEKKMVKDFPDVNCSLNNPNGLLAIGGDLSINRLLAAYKKGIFPWFNEGQPILWWSPNPRCVMKPNEMHISRSLSKHLRSKKFIITYNQNFKNVINECSSNRNNNDTWLTNSMIEAYINLHNSGYAHSVECWHDQKLVGGLYGVAMGKIFFGESMFSKESDASKISLVYLSRRLCEMRFKIIDCQISSDHLLKLGAKLISRKKFTKILINYCNLNKTAFDKDN